ncbi:MAG: hypothetical protein R3324_01550 [Halobacteriales archaeon]|nr:hypothetical protein [Halobacteriales archaeon]
MVAERARQDAPDFICAMCENDTPLSAFNASDLHTVRFVEDVSNAVHKRICDLDGRTVDEIAPDDPDSGLCDGWWITDEMVEHYRAAFFDACPPAEECEICRHEETCGHTLRGEECPLWSGDDDGGLAP